MSADDIQAIHAARTAARHYAANPADLERWYKLESALWALIDHGKRTAQLPIRYYVNGQAVDASFTENPERQ